jgi:hypothetical protein
MTTDHHAEALRLVEAGDGPDRAEELAAAQVHAFLGLTEAVRDVGRLLAAIRLAAAGADWQIAWDAVMRDAVDDAAYIDHLLHPGSPDPDAPVRAPDDVTEGG